MRVPPIRLSVRGFLWIAYAWVAYLAFARSTIYLILFLADLGVAKTVDRGGAIGSTSHSLAADLGWDLFLIGAFCAHHSVMARPWAKRWLETRVPPALERSTYVLVSSLLLILLMWQWRPVPALVWDVDSEIGHFALRAISFLGWATALLASFRLGHLETFGVRRVWSAVRGSGYPERGLKTDSLYRWVRHPMYVGFLIGLWSTPKMSVGHLSLAATLTLYLFLGRVLEERELVKRFGDCYVAYRRKVPAFLPGGRIGQAEKRRND